MYKEREVWNNFLKEPRKAIENHLKNNILVEKILEYTKKNYMVLEVGCGTAIDSCIVSKLGRESFALDKSLSSLMSSKKSSEILHAKVRIIRADVANMPFKNDKFDLVFSSGLIHFFRNPNEIFIEQRRILKNGGILVVDVPYTYSLHTPKKHIKRLFGMWPWGWETQYVYKNLKKIFLRNGFDVVEHFFHNLDSISLNIIKLSKKLNKNFGEEVKKILNRFPQDMCIVGVKK